MTTSSLIGAPVGRIEGPSKVTGAIHYAGDIDLPGMLWGRILRSPYPHARITRVDASKAWTVPGVRAVVTGADNPGLIAGKILEVAAEAGSEGEEGAGFAEDGTVAPIAGGAAARRGRRGA